MCCVLRAVCVRVRVGVGRRVCVCVLRVHAGVGVGVGVRVCVRVWMCCVCKHPRSKAISFNIINVCDGSGLEKQIRVISKKMNKS